MRIVLTGLVCVALATAAQAVYLDDFESYADTTDMMAVGNWGDDSGTGGQLFTAGGNPDAYAWHPGGATMNHVFAPTNPSDAFPIVWEFDLYDIGGVDTPSPANTRLTGGLRDNGGGAGLNSILEMGIYNSSIDATDGSVVGNGYAVRTVFIGGNPSGNGGWVAFPGAANVKEAGWHHFKATIGANSILFELDKFDDGTVDGSILINTDDTSGIAYNIARFGGPSGISSAGGAGMDNLSIQVIPEPATLALLGLGGLFLMRRRRA